MTAAPQFLAAAEGFDKYTTGALGSNWPWATTNTAYQGTVTASAGAFTGNALAFPTAAANTSGMTYQFPSTMQFMRSLAAVGGSGAFGVSGWVSLGASAAQGTNTLLGLGSANAGAAVFALLGQTYSSGGGLALVFPSTTVNLTTAPYSFAVTPNTYYWVGLYFAYKPTGALTATYCVNGVPIFTDVTVAFASDIFTAGNIANQLKLYAGPVGTWTLDDLIVQNVSSADALWPGTATPETIPQFSPRHITMATITGNGTLNQWVASGSEPNYQSVTDPTGANSVTANAVSLTDRYKWSTSAVDIKGVVYRGASTRYANISPVQLVGSTQTVMNTNTGASEYIGVSENDGTNLWTAASIAAGEFGQTSHS
jgi:hypothetical protein